MKPNRKLLVFLHDQTTTAFFVAGGLPPLTVVMHLQRRRRRLPQHVAVIACDDDAALGCTSYGGTPLISVATPPLKGSATRRRRAK